MGSSSSRRWRAAIRGRKHESLSESRMREIRLSGLMSGDRKRNHGSDCDTGESRKRPDTQQPWSYSHRAGPRLYPDEDAGPVWHRRPLTDGGFAREARAVGDRRETGDAR